MTGKCLICTEEVTPDHYGIPLLCERCTVLFEVAWKSKAIPNNAIPSYLKMGADTDACCHKCGANNAITLVNSLMGFLPIECKECADEEGKWIYLNQNPDRGSLPLPMDLDKVKKYLSKEQWEAWGDYLENRDVFGNLVTKGDIE